MFVNTVTYIMVMSLVASNVSIASSKNQSGTAITHYIVGWRFHEEGYMRCDGVRWICDRSNHRSAVLPQQRVSNLSNWFSRVLCFDRSYDRNSNWFLVSSLTYSLRSVGQALTEVFLASTSVGRIIAETESRQPSTLVSKMTL